jgi:hypothetical protein
LEEFVFHPKTTKSAVDGDHLMFESEISTIKSNSDLLV